MRKVIAIGDVHAEWERLWGALRGACAVDAAGQPTPPVLAGRYQVVLLGDLVHPKSASAYEALTGRAPYDPTDREHLRAAWRAQVRELSRLWRYAGAARGGLTVLLGNHDAAALWGRHLLQNRAGLVHAEFDEAHGGLPLPEHLASWMRGWPLELRLGPVHVAHAGPTPGMRSYDDFFYGDPDTKEWWRTRPHLVRDAGFAYGVYGHTVMRGGVHLDSGGRFAMVDALERREYLELMLGDDGDFEARVASF